MKCVYALSLLGPTLWDYTKDVVDIFACLASLLATSFKMLCCFLFFVVGLYLVSEIQRVINPISSSL